jgi:hypothetical protein
MSVVEWTFSKKIKPNSLTSFYPTCKSDVVMLTISALPNGRTRKGEKGPQTVSRYTRRASVPPQCEVGQWVELQLKVRLNGGYIDIK